MTLKSTKCKRNSKHNNTPTVKRFRRLITWKLEPPNLKSNQKMSNGNLSNPDKIILPLMKDQPRKNSTRKNFLLYFKILKDKKIKWKWKFMSCQILKLKNPEQLTHFNCNFVTLRPAKDHYKKKLLISLKTLLIFKPISH